MSASTAEVFPTEADHSRTMNGGVLDPARQTLDFSRHPRSNAASPLCDPQRPCRPGLMRIAPERHRSPGWAMAEIVIQNSVGGATVIDCLPMPYRPHA